MPEDHRIFQLAALLLLEVNGYCKAETPVKQGDFAWVPVAVHLKKPAHALLAALESHFQIEAKHGEAITSPMLAARLDGSHSSLDKQLKGNRARHCHKGLLEKFLGSVAHRDIKWGQQEYTSAQQSESVAGGVHALRPLGQRAGEPQPIKRFATTVGTEDVLDQGGDNSSVELADVSSSAEPTSGIDRQLQALMAGSRLSFGPAHRLTFGSGALAKPQQQVSITPDAQPFDNTFPSVPPNVLQPSSGYSDPPVARTPLDAVHRQRFGCSTWDDELGCSCGQASIAPSDAEPEAEAATANQEAANTKRTAIFLTGWETDEEPPLHGGDASEPSGRISAIAAAEIIECPVEDAANDFHGGAIGDTGGASDSGLNAWGSLFAGLPRAAADEEIVGAHAQCQPPLAGQKH